MSLHELFAEHFGADDDTFLIRSPGRVNLIGEHIDYNDGFVLPFAVSLELQFKLRPRADRIVKLYATDFGETQEFSLDNLPAHRGGGELQFTNYVQGVARELASASVPLHGFEGVITSSLPISSGLSSSAALEVGAALAFLHLAQQPLSAADTARLCQKAENNFVGVPCGIMDQMAVAACLTNHALLLDCRTNSYEQVPFRLQHHSVIVTNSAAPRNLAESAYKQRVEECAAGMKALQKFVPTLNSYREVTAEILAEFGGALEPTVRKRVQHVVGEIARTTSACEQLRQGNLTVFGDLMNASHESLATFYEVSSPQLDWLTQWARRQPGVLGSRLTGAGFGGCTVTLIENSAIEHFVATLPGEYKAAFGLDARCWVCVPVDGAQVLRKN